MFLAVLVCGKKISYAKGRPLQCGITIDCSSRSYTVPDIEQYIDLVSRYKNSFIQLHLTGDRGIGVECRTLDYFAEDHPVLGSGDIQKILQYAKKKKVQIVPEIDMPGHMGAFYRLLEKKEGREYARSICKAEYDGELDIENKDAIVFAKSIYSEYAALFKGCKYFHIGGDEFFSENSRKNISYINSIASYMQKKGFVVRIWNDLLTKKNYKKLNRKVQVTYWSLDGDIQNRKEKKRRRKKRVSYPQLQKRGIDVLNYNSYYLYTTPDRKNVTKKNQDYMCKDAKKNWTPLVWDYHKGKPKKSNTSVRVVGSSISIWNENSAGLTNQQIFDYVRKLYPVIVKRSKGMSYKKKTKTTG